MVSKEEFEILIEKELKTFSEKKIKYLSYDDMFDIINELSDVKIER